MRLFFGPQVDRPPLGLPVRARVGRLRQPLTGDLIKMFQRAELAAIEQVDFYIVERPFHFPLGQSRRLHLICRVVREPLW
jgi:hypothetical protein